MTTLCPTLLNRGYCLGNHCQNIHDTSNFCSSCHIAFTSAAEYNTHASTAAHRQEESTSRWVHCIPCKRDYKLGSPEQTSHERSSGHLSKASRLISTGASFHRDTAAPGTTKCEVCNITVQSSTYTQHCRSTEHSSRLQVFNYLNAVRLTQKNQSGVEVSGNEEGVDLGVCALQSAGDPAILWISYTGSTQVSLIQARTSSALGARPGQLLCFTVSTIALPVFIEQGSSVAVQIQFNPQGQRGRFEDRLELVFRNSNNRMFVITRPLRATVGNNDLATLAPVAPYTRPTRARQRGVRLHIIDGGEQLSSAPRYERRLEPYGIPGDIKQLLIESTLEQQLENFSSRFMPEALSISSYSQHWSSLVHSEHVQAEIDLSNFDMDDVRLVKMGRLYELGVPGLAEKRPSVLKGDRINIHPHDRDEGVWYKGIVHDVLLSTVRISFHPSFPHSPTALYDVEFILNPVPFRRMLQAVKINMPRHDILFPTMENTNLQDTGEANANPLANTYNHLVNSNEEQLQAVKRVISLPSGSSPFVIFGPPGTGKTMTIVECIAQLLDNPSARVLACAPSNSASDLIAQRLIDTRSLDTSELFRLNAIWRPRIELPEDLVEYSLLGHGFEVPKREKLSSFRVVVSTCSSAALLYARKIDPGHFTHIFIDEAGQACEPEVMIPTLLLADKNTNVTLSGDPKQLGPVIRSPVARRLGMSTSYLERLMSLPAYDEVTMRGISVAKLLKNFRSHPSILSFPNQQFYRNELVAHASSNITDTFLSWNRLATPNFPIVFEAITGEDMREATSPSFFNPHEASLVKEYVQGLMPYMATTSQIGIVTPYRAQVRKIRQLLREINISNIDVGSVENFQGQERQVIILSTVRSNSDYLSFDVKHTLGFVSNRRRLNVAITRAQALLIIIGDPAVLGLDRLWRRLLYYIHQSGGWKGSPFPWDPNSNPDDEPTRPLAEREVIELLRRAGADGTDGTDDDVAGVGNE